MWNLQIPPFCLLPRWRTEPCARITARGKKSWRHQRDHNAPRARTLPGNPLLWGGLSCPRLFRNHSKSPSKQQASAFLKERLSPTLSTSPTMKRGRSIYIFKSSSSDVVVFVHAPPFLEGAFGVYRGCSLLVMPRHIEAFPGVEELCRLGFDRLV